jgi:predicted ATPase
MHLEKAVIDSHGYPTRKKYPFNLPVFRDSQELSLSSPVTIFTGENGTGKSTLLKALCIRCNIHIWEGMQRPRYENNPYENMLPDSLDVKWAHGPVPGSFFSPELFRNFSLLIDEWAISNPSLLKYYGGESLVTQSHGQACMAYFETRYKVKGLHFLDEPEAALSPTTQLKLLKLITEMSLRGHAQFIISTHSPILMSCSQACLYNFSENGILPVIYKETEHYKVYSEFFKSDS